MLTSLLKATGPAKAPISPKRELGAYEALWLEQGATFKTIAERFADDPEALPSDFVSPASVEECARSVLERFAKAGVSHFGVRINHAGDYPPKLRDARHPVELLYFSGAWEPDRNAMCSRGWNAGTYRRRFAPGCKGQPRPS